jgi:thymidylate synthase
MPSTRMPASCIVQAREDSAADDEYLQLVRDVLKHGDLQEGRNGKVRVVVGAALAFSLRDGRLPFITTKRLAWKTCLKELLWFIRGSTSAKELAAEGCHIWDANATREFLDSRGLHKTPEGELGPVYGAQWRRWRDSHPAATGHGHDQLAQAIHLLRDPTTRSSRRIIVSAWNVSDLDDMALPPCHLLYQFNVVNGDELVCTMYQRSVDVGLGLPFNIASYAMLTHFVARAVGLRATRLVMMLSNVHIYENHVGELTEQLRRTPSMKIPRIELDRIPTDIDAVRLEHVHVVDYEHAGDLPMPMSA